MSLDLPASEFAVWSTLVVSGIVSTVLFWNQQRLGQTSTSMTKRDGHTMESKEGPRAWKLWHKANCTFKYTKFPAVSTVTVLDRPDDEPEAIMTAYRQATTDLAERYPMLRGELAIQTSNDGCEGRAFLAPPLLELWVREGVRSANDDSFFATVDLRRHSTFLKMFEETHDQENPQLVPHRVMPLLKPYLDDALAIDEAIKQQKPLFAVRLVLLPRGIYAIQFSITHALADGYTHYRLLDDLNRLVTHHLAGDEASSAVPPLQPALDWNRLDLHAVHEMEEGEMDQRLMNSSHAFAWSSVKSLLHMAVSPRKAQTVVVSRTTVQDIKQEYRSASPLGFVSSNDVFMAALHQAMPTHEMSALVRNERSLRDKAANENDAGNYMSVIYCPAELGRDPAAVRTIVHRGYHYEPNTLPSGFLQNNKWFMGTSWTTAQSSDGWLYPKGSRLMGHVPHPDFVTNMPIDLAVIYTLDETHVGIMHNFRGNQLKLKGSLLERLSAQV